MVPAQATVGDTLEFSIELPGYPADIWSGTLYLVSSAAAHEVDGTLDGTAHRFTADAAETAEYAPGRYSWAIRVVSDGVVKTAADGSIEFLPDPTKQRDTRSMARKILEAVEAFLAGNASTAQQSMEVVTPAGGRRALSRWPLPELTQLRRELKREVRAEDQARKGGAGRNIKVRYGRR